MSKSGMASLFVRNDGGRRVRCGSPRLGAGSNCLLRENRCDVKRKGNKTRKKEIKKERKKIIMRESGTKKT